MVPSSDYRTHTIAHREFMRIRVYAALFGIPVMYLGCWVSLARLVCVTPQSHCMMTVLILECVEFSRG